MLLACQLGSRTELQGGCRGCARLGATLAAAAHVNASPRSDSSKRDVSQTLTIMVNKLAAIVGSFAAVIALVFAAPVGPVSQVFAPNP